jgi:hypothetical protein
MYNIQASDYWHHILMISWYYISEVPELVLAVYIQELHMIVEGV